MPTIEQIETIIAAVIFEDERNANHGGNTNPITVAAEKIVALFDDHGETLAAAAVLENEVTSALVDMTIATVLATLIEEEGGGRSNISISPMSMDHMMKNYTFEVKHDGLIRNVSITLREGSDLRDEDKWREPSNRHGVMHQDESTEGALPQAEPRVYDRPVWAVKFYAARGDGVWVPGLKQCKDRADAEHTVRGYHDNDGRPDAVIENRCCLHTDCPSSACMK